MHYLYRKSARVQCRHRFHRNCNKQSIIPDVKLLTSCICLVERCLIKKQHRHLTEFLNARMHLITAEQTRTICKWYVGTWLNVALFLFLIALGKIIPSPGWFNMYLRTNVISSRTMCCTTTDSSCEFHLCMSKMNDNAAKQFPL